MPLPTTFAGVSARGEGLFVKSGLAPFTKLWFAGTYGSSVKFGYVTPGLIGVTPVANIGSSSMNTNSQQICTDSLGRICLPNYGSSTIDFVTSAGVTTILNISPGIIKGGCVLGPDNNVWVGYFDYGGSANAGFAKISPSLTTTLYVTSSGNSPTFMCTDGVSTIYTTDTSSSNVYSFNISSPTIYTIFATRGSSSYGGICYGPDGKIYSSYSATLGFKLSRRTAWYLAQITTSGTVTQLLIDDAGPGGSSYGFTTLAGGDGNIYVSGISTTFQYATLAKYTISTNTINIPNFSSFGSSQSLFGLCYAPDGNLYATSSSGNPGYISITPSFTFTAYTFSYSDFSNTYLVCMGPS